MPDDYMNNDDDDGVDNDGPIGDDVLNNTNYSINDSNTDLFNSRSAIFNDQSLVPAPPKVIQIHSQARYFLISLKENKWSESIS